MALTNAERQRAYRERHPERARLSNIRSKEKHGKENSKRYREKKKRYYAEHPEEYLKLRKKLRPIERKFNKKYRPKKDIISLNWIYEQRLSGCEICGEKDPRCIVFHHKDPATKSFNMTEKSRGIKSLSIELEKCIVICSNCHMKLHYVDRGILPIPVHGLTLE